MARCRAQNAAGQPCRAPESMVDPFGYCPAHRPGGRKRLAEAGRIGAEVSKQVRRRGKGLLSGELPPLRTPQDAEAWLETVGREPGSSS